jgi:ABC-type glycerol-3-phosphate transport system substrate-binding protein
MKWFSYFSLLLLGGMMIFTGCNKQTSFGTSGPIRIVLAAPLWSPLNPAGPQSQRLRGIIAEKMGVDIEVIGLPDPSGEDQINFINLRLSSGQQMDLFILDHPLLGGAVWRTYKNQGLIISLNDLIDNYGQDFKKAIDPRSWPYVSDTEGKIWALPFEQAPYSTRFIMRQDWLDQLGLEPPKTIAEFENIMQAFKDKFNDPGFVAPWARAEENIFVGTFVKKPDTHLDENGNVRPIWIQEGYTDYLAKMAEWYRKGYLHSEIFTLDYTGASELMWGGRTGFMMTWQHPYDLLALEALVKENVPTARFSPVAPPNGGKMTALPIVNTDVMITSSCKNPEAVMKFINWSMGTDEGWSLVWAGEEGVDYKLNADKTITYIGEDNSGTGGVGLYCTAIPLDRWGKLLSDINNVILENFYSNPQTYPLYESPLLGFVFDQDKLQPLQDRLQQLEVENKELYSKIIMGQAQPAEWDVFVKKYMAGGGQALFDEMTRQFNDSKK